MKRIVVDSSVCVNWFVKSRNKRERTAALDLLEYARGKKAFVTQPPMWREHVTSLVFRKRGVVANNVVETLLALDAKDHGGASVLRLAVEIATSVRADLFDALYHAVAIDKGLDLITTNDEYARRAGGLGHVWLLADWPARARIAERDKRYPQRQSAAPGPAHKKR